MKHRWNKNQFKPHSKGILIHHSESIPVGTKLYDRSVIWQNIPSLEKGFEKYHRVIDSRSGVDKFTVMYSRSCAYDVCKGDCEYCCRLWKMTKHG
jgi:hypothetical protein